MLKSSKIKIFTFIKEYSFDRHYSSLLFIVFTLIALARAFQHFYIVDINEPVQYSLWWHIPFNLFLWWNWFLFIPLIYWVAVKFPFEKMKFPYWTIIYFIMPLLIVLIRQSVASLITVLILTDKTDFFVMIKWRLLVNPWIWLDFIIYFAILVGILLVEYSRKVRVSEIKYSQLMTQLANSQLNALKSQLHPHFLFNTLNTISTLILKSDKSEAERMLSLLNNFLKNTIIESDKHEVTLKEELQYIHDYLEIEKVRFGDKIVVIETIEEGALRAYVPNLLLQPIIENSVYHAIAQKTFGGIIKIISKREDGFLKILIEDNGPGLDSIRKSGKKKKDGIGLKITKNRLSQLYGSNHRFLIENISEGGTRVRIELPYKV